MNLIVCDNYEEMSQVAAKMIAEQLSKKSDSVLGLSAGDTTAGLYEILSEMNKNNEIDFKDVKTFNLNEYYGLPTDHKQSYQYFMDEKFFKNINIKNENIHFLNGLCEDVKAECANYEKLITENNGIDLQILGIGQHGRIGFNEPNQTLSSTTHLTDLLPNKIEANLKNFDNPDDVPTKAMTMGIGTILKSKKIILMASGANKYASIESMLTDNITTATPASMLKVHSDVTIICDKAAYSKGYMGIDIGGTDIKFGIIDNNNELIHQSLIPTISDNLDNLINSIVDKSKELMKEFSITSIGVGTPGLIRNGLVESANLPFNNTPLADILAEKLCVSVRVSNDANCAALAESICGSDKKSKNLVLVSLGTGIGGGIVLNGKIHEGRGSAGEIGHMCIEVGGKECGCGEKGCWEQYASARALVNMATDAAQANTDSILNKKYNENNKMNGKIFFSAIQEDCPVAQKVLDVYTDYLAAGIIGIIYIFDPDNIVLAGGITNAGDLLLEPLKKKISFDVEISISKLKNNAGAIGAALLQKG